MKHEPRSKTTRALKKQHEQSKMSICTKVQTMHNPKLHELRSRESKHLFETFLWSNKYEAVAKQPAEDQTHNRAMPRLKVSPATAFSWKCQMILFLLRCVESYLCLDRIK